MKLHGFNHVNIGCSPRDLAAEAPQTVASGTLAPMQFPA